MSEHTPGRWRVASSSRKIHGLTIRSDEDGGVYIAALPGERGDTPANARLIAAAPELLGVLRAVNGHHAIPPDSHLGERIAAAIAKAEATE